MLQPTQPAPPPSPYHDEIRSIIEAYEYIVQLL